MAELKSGVIFLPGRQAACALQVIVVTLYVCNHSHLRYYVVFCLFSPFPPPFPLSFPPSNQTSFPLVLEYQIHLQLRSSKSPPRAKGFLVEIFLTSHLRCGSICPSHPSAWLPPTSAALGSLPLPPTHLFQSQSRGSNPLHARLHTHLLPLTHRHHRQTSTPPFLTRKIAFCTHA
jgi:hypothetical protein